MGEQTIKSTNITTVESRVTLRDRIERSGHRGGVLWFTGLSGSGKSTLAIELERRLFNIGYNVFMLDGDNVRHGLNKNLGFSAEDRAENIRRIGEVSRLFADAGIITITSFISPYRADRDQVRALHDESGMAFIEVFVDCALEEAEKRDPKGLYKKARAGEIKNFTGIDDPYEAPESPEIHLHTDQMSLDAEVDLLIDYLEERGILAA